MSLRDTVRALCRPRRATIVEGVGDGDLDRQVQDVNGRTGKLLQFVDQQVIGANGIAARRRMAMVAWDDRQKEQQLSDPAVLRLVGAR